MIVWKDGDGRPVLSPEQALLLVGKERDEWKARYEAAREVAIGFERLIDQFSMVKNLPSKVDLYIKKEIEKRLSEKK